MINKTQHLPAIIYLFSPRLINWHTRQVLGYIQASQHKGKIIRRTYPLPRAVYNRVPSRSLEARKSFRFMTQKFKQLGIKMFNPHFFNKSEIHYCLKSDPYLNRHLPKTSMGLTKHNLTVALKNYPTIFVKHRNGSLGVGVIKITTAKNGYHLHYRLGTRNITHLAPNLNQLRAKLLPLVKRGAIIQQAIPLARYRGRVFDIRVLMQRSANGNWIQTYTFAKVAAPGSVASNVAAGGSILNTNTALRYAFPTARQRSKIDCEIHKISVKAMRRLAARFKYLGEAGIDIGISQTGQVWIIEVNAKYARHVFPKKIQKLSLARPLRYAIKLARKNP